MLPKTRDGARVLGGLYLVDSKAPVYCIKFRRPVNQPGKFPAMRDYLFQGWRVNLDKILPKLEVMNRKDGLTQVDIHMVYDWDYNPARG